MLTKIKKFIQKIKDKNNYKKGVQKLDEGYYKEAADILSKLEKSETVDRKMLYFNLGGALIGQDKLEQGEKYLRQAVEIGAGHNYIWATLAEVNILQRKWNKAEKAINKAIELEPEKDFYELKKEVICGSEELKENYLKHFELLKKAIEEQKKENWEQSLELLKEASTYYNKTGYLYNQIGAIYNNNLGNQELAAQFFKKAIEKEPDNQVFIRNLKQVLK